MPRACIQALRAAGVTCSMTAVPVAAPLRVPPEAGRPLLAAVLESLGVAPDALGPGGAVANAFVGSAAPPVALAPRVEASPLAGEDGREAHVIIELLAVLVEAPLGAINALRPRPIRRGGAPQVPGAAASGRRVAIGDDGPGRREGAGPAADVCRNAPHLCIHQDAIVAEAVLRAIDALRPSSVGLGHADEPFGTWPPAGRAAAASDPRVVRVGAVVAALGGRAVLLQSTQRTRSLEGSLLCRV
mmetsp:Transcript_44006/g.136957  ORF Transcript_44006/g.136957 Transcript_44006/m.136957 type:complete len:244 (-) Transcript_44006:232-963(-)